MLSEKVALNLSVAKMKIQFDKIIKPEILCNMHIHPELEFLYILKGKVLYYTENSCFEINSGEIVFSNSNAAHYTKSIEDNTEYVCIYFKKPNKPFESTKYLSDFLHKGSCPYHVFKKSDDDTSALTEILDTMAYEYKHSLDAREYSLLSKKYELITFLYRNKYLEEEKRLLNENIKPILPILKFIEENYQNPIKLEDISKIKNLHQNYVCRLFKRITNKTITDYITYVRICEATDLLKSDIPLSEIAYKVGFSSQSYFNKVFKKYMFYTPLEYKKLNKNVQY